VPEHITLLPPQAEQRRLDALDELQVLDTPPDPRFDAVTRLAQQVFGVPMVSVTLVDRSRQWRKSMQGPLNRVEPRRDSFCEAVVLKAAPIVVPDATRDDVFRDNPFVLGDPRLRFYAGEPLHAPTGEPVGSFCLMDTEPRELSVVQRAMLSDLARYVETELARDADVERAAEVQQGLLPKRSPAVAGWELGGALAAARRVGGDFYDWYRVPDGAAFTLADVMGKGIGAAILASEVRAVLRSASRTSATPAAVLEQAAEVLAPDLAEAGAFVTVFSAVLAPDGEVRFADAGHGLGLVVRAAGDLEPVTGPDLPLGILDADGFTDCTVHLEPGDALVLFSDGLLDALGDTAAVHARVVAVLRETGRARDAARALRDLVPEAALPDDVTVVVARRTA
jgi:hypothetical protein